MSDDRTWLRHGEHGGYFHCPNGVLKEFAALGWVPSEPAPEFNAATAEMPKPPTEPVAEIPPTEPGKKSGATSKGSE